MWPVPDRSGLPPAGACWPRPSLKRREGGRRAHRAGQVGGSLAGKPSCGGVAASGALAPPAPWAERGCRRRGHVSCGPPKAQRSGSRKASADGEAHLESQTPNYGEAVFGVRTAPGEALKAKAEFSTRAVSGRALEDGVEKRWESATSRGYSTRTEALIDCTLAVWYLEAGWGGGWQCRCLLLCHILIRVSLSHCKALSSRRSDSSAHLVTEGGGLPSSESPHPSQKMPVQLSFPLLGRERLISLLSSRFHFCH